MSKVSAGLSMVLLVVISAAVRAGAYAHVSSESQCASIAAVDPSLPPATFSDGPIIASAALTADFDTWIAGMRQLNPDLSIRTDIPGLKRKAAVIRAKLRQPMSRREAWLLFSEINPYLHDGHSGIQMPDYRGALGAHLKAGGHIVPVDIRFASDGSMRILTAVSDSAGLNPEDRVLSINGHSSTEMITAMMARAIGDNPRSQRAWLERRFAMLFWYLYGDTGQYEVVSQAEAGGCPAQIEVAGGTTLPVPLQPDPAAQEIFAWRVFPGDIGYLRVDSFAPDLKDAFDRFTQTAFAAFKTQSVHALIIDVRENGVVMILFGNRTLSITSRRRPTSSSLIT